MTYLGHMTTSPVAAPSATIPAWTTGDRLRKAREAAGLNQYEMGDALGVSHKTIGNYERGRTRIQRLALREWSVVCKVPMEWLAFGPQPDGGSPNHQPAGDPYGLSPTWPSLAAVA